MGRGARTLACRVDNRVDAWSERSHVCERGTQECVRHILCQMVFFLCLTLSCLAAQAQVVRISVFSLFKPTELRIAPALGSVLSINGDARTILEGHQSYTIRHSRLQVTARDGSDADFRLSIPGKIQRQFHGKLTVYPDGRKLIAIVTMDREIAVASVVAAEMPRSTPSEALKAQAVVARSYYAASPIRHDGFDFCDTTHCQFLRSPPLSTSPAFHATQATRGLLLEYMDKPIEALYSASCGGRTRSLETGPYPYFSVPCDYCQRHSPGHVQGHQLGLCQSGAAAMAASGATFRSILDHYYPGTSVTTPMIFSTFLLPPSATLRHSKN